MAQSATSGSETQALDLRVPQAPIHYLGGDYRQDPPGTYYGDTSGKPTCVDCTEGAADNQWQVHGSVSAGIGYSKHGGNSNWQTANVNLDKTYTDDDGDTGHVGLSISVGQGEGPIFGPGYYYGHGPGGYGPPSPRW